MQYVISRQSKLIMRVRAELVFAVYFVLCCAPISANREEPQEFPKTVKLGGKYFSFVDEKGALSLFYNEAREKCSQYYADLWDINTGPALRGGNLRADKDVARKVLDAFRNVPQVKKQIEQDEILQRLNVVMGKKRNEDENVCKWYLAGPYNKDFYAFTFYNDCPKEPEPEGRFWFICEGSFEDEVTTTSEATTKARTEITVTEKELTESTPALKGDQEIIRGINETIDGATNASILIDDVNSRIENLANPIKGLESFQKNLFDSIERLVVGNAKNAASATKDLFSKTVPQLARRITAKNDYVSIVRFAQNITSRIAAHTDNGTDINNFNDTESPILFRLRTLQRDRFFDSTVKTSTVKADLLTDDPERGIMLTTHMEYRNPTVQQEMIENSFNNTQRFSSDLVEFYIKYKNGDPYDGEVEVDLLFERASRQARRSVEHECVFYNIIDKKLDATGCEFQSVTPNGKVHCRCNHTTSFGSVFMPKDFNDKYRNILDIFSLSLDVISLTALLLSILVFLLIRQIRTLLTIIHLNLCISLFVCELLIAAQNIIYRLMNDNMDEWACSKPVGMLFHYLYLTVIAWLALEGVYILQLMIIVFKPPDSHARFYLAVGYLLPALFPLIAIFFDNPYESSNQLCFLRKGSLVYWTFLAPLATMLLVNLFATSTVMYRLCTVTRNNKTVKSELLRYLRGLFCMTALLGLQWGLGLASLLIESGDMTTFICVLLFLFVTLSQGPLIFVVHIMLVKDIRYAVARYLSKGGRFSRQIANIIRPPPPVLETNFRHGSSTRTTEIGSTNSSSSAAQTPLELSYVRTSPSCGRKGAR